MVVCSNLNLRKINPFIFKKKLTRRRDYQLPIINRFKQTETQFQLKQRMDQNHALRNKKIPKKATIIVLIMALSAVILSLALNVAFHQQLYRMGLNFIYEYQTYASDQFTRFFFNAVSFLGEGVVVPIYLFGFFLANKNKLSATVLLAYFIINIYLVSILKSAFKSPRPFWQNQPIKFLQYTFCSSQYGHPSGHSWVSVLFVQPIFTDFLGTGRYYLFLLVPILTGILIPLSRMYLGLHSADQIVMGLMFSVTSLVLYRYLFQKQMIKTVWQFMVKKRYPAQICNPAYIILLILNFVAIIIPIITFHVTRNNPLDQKLIQTINQVCDTEKTFQSIEQSSWLEGSIGNLFFGIMFGFLLLGFNKEAQGQQLERGKDNQNNQNNKEIGQLKTYYGQFLTGQWSYKNKTSIIKILFLYIATILVAGTPFFLPILFIKNAFTKYFLASFGFQVIGIIISGVVPQLIRRFAFIKLDSDQSIVSDDFKPNQLSQKNSKKNKYSQTQRQISRSLYR